MILPTDATPRHQASTDLFEMLAMENPICEERFYFDEWKPSTTQQGNPSDAEIKQSWRGDSYDDQNSWMPPTTNMDNRFNTSISTGIDASANWKDKPVEQWSADEVTLWICSLMNPSQSPRSPFDGSSYSPAAVNVAAYLNLSGAELMQMSSTEIQARDPQSGPFVFMSLQNYLSQTTNSHYNISSTLLPSYNHMDPGPQNVDMHSPMPNMPGIKQEPSIKVFASPTPRLPSLDFKLISFDIDDRFASIPSLNGTLTAEKLGIKHTPLNNMINRTNGFHLPPQPFNMSPNARAWIEQPNGSPMSSSPMISPRSEGSITPPEVSSRDFNPGHYPYTTEVKGNHLWEFIRDLLFDSRYNPSLVKWEDREEGVFKFVKSDQVAKLWGKKKNNPVMTYEKLSRAMRYYYRRKILERIDGRRLVYKFGSMATGWKA